MNPAVAALNRKSRNLFLLAAVLAILWIGLDFLAPDLAVGRIPFRLVVMIACDGVFLFGLWRALVRAGFSAAARVAAWSAVALILAIWLGAIWTLAVKGVFQRDIGNVPVLPIAIFLPVVLGLFAVTRSEGVGRLLDATPASWLVGIQVYRILGGMFLVYWIRDAIPGAFALPAGIGDVATGLLALPAAAWVASGSPKGTAIGIRWNVLGLIDFTIAIATGFLTSPGPGHLLALDHPNTLIATFPTAMIPGFAVPFSILLHALSLRQLKRAQGTKTTVTRTPILAGA